MIIADDEAHARERLKELLERFALFDIVAQAADGSEALEVIIKHKPDVAFLDINMPGISVFSSIPSLQNPPHIVFQTAYSQHAAAAYDMNALDYLLKPVRFERLEQTVKKIKDVCGRHGAEKTALPDSTGRSDGHITISSGGTTSVIAAEEIFRISFENGFCYVYTKSGRLISDKYLNYYEQKLTGGSFFRTSRNDMVNVHHITLIRKELPGMYVIVLRDGSQVEVSRRRAQVLRTIVEF